MRWLLLLLSMCSFHIHARVELQSVYFIGKSTELTEYSGFILDRLKSSFSKGDYQIIEINAFCEGSEAATCKEIAKQRLDVVFNKLQTDSSNVTLNSYGSQHIPINFTPVHWNRVDIYYNVNESWREQESPLKDKVAEKSAQEDSVATLIHTPKEDSESTFVEIPERELIQVDTPIPVPLYFQANKGVMKRESQPVLDQLYRTLMAYPELNAHFRGHVCCGRNKRISKKRARYVYKYLRKRGVPKERISYEGYSNTIPLVSPERTEADREKNRRVDVIYTK